jgi:hypothetical protein
MLTGVVPAEDGCSCVVEGPSPLYIPSLIFILVKAFGGATEGGIDTPFGSGVDMPAP